MARCKALGVAGFLSRPACYSKPHGFAQDIMDGMAT